jgi:hypothetical protein
VSSYYYIRDGRLAVKPNTQVYMCPHTTIYICVLILLYVSSYCYMCPHTTMCLLILLYMCPHTTICVSSYYHTCVLILLYMCPHAAICVGMRSILLYICRHTSRYSRCPRASAQWASSSFCAMGVRSLVYGRLFSFVYDIYIYIRAAVILAVAQTLEDTYVPVLLFPSSSPAPRPWALLLVSWHDLVEWCQHRRRHAGLLVLSLRSSA